MNQYYSDTIIFFLKNILPVYLILFPSKTVQKKGTDSNVVGFFSIFKAATLPEMKKKHINQMFIQV